MQLSQQNYLTKMDLDGSVFLCENPVFVCLGHCDTTSVHLVLPQPGRTQTDVKKGFSQGNNGVVQVRFGEVVLLCMLHYAPKFLATQLFTISNFLTKQHPVARY